MTYALDGYANFEHEQQILSTASKKKANIEKQKEQLEIEILYRIKSIKGYFIRLSWIHKKEFILSILRRIKSFDTLLKIINYISTLHGKMAAYTDVSPQVRCISQQILLDHDRTNDQKFLKETACEDLNWIETLNEAQKMNLIMDLLSLSGTGLMRKLYIPLVVIYNKKVLEDEKRALETGKAEQQCLDELFNDKHLDDTSKYPQDHPLSIEVEKMRRKWEEIIDKSRRDVFEKKTLAKDKAAKKNNVEKKSKTETKAQSTSKASGNVTEDGKKGSKAQADTVDWIQTLPIWIVKQIFNYLDQKTLINLKKVNPYWSYICDSIIKDRQARSFLDQSIENMRNNIDPEILKQCDEDAEFLKSFYSPVKEVDCPRERRLKKLLNRGAILKQMVPELDKSQQVQSNLLTHMSKNVNIICTPLDKITVFPRLIREDLLLYKNYPCYLKDVNIVIDVQGDVRRQRDTLTYSLSQQLSDTFSMSEADLADW